MSLPQSVFGDTPSPVTYRTSTYVLSRADFPGPVADLAQGKVWRTDDVDHWIREHRPEPN